MILALFIVPGDLGYGGVGDVDKGHGFGYWASLVVIIAGLVLSFMRAQQTNTAMPGGEQGAEDRQVSNMARPIRLRHRVRRAASQGPGPADHVE